jgi:lipopolysaccharide transport system permease protein
MTSLTAGPTGDQYSHSPELAASFPRIRIEPPHGLFELRVREVWAYRELMYFFVWRDLKVRYKQTVVGVAWVIIQPLLSMGVFTIFFGRLAKLPSDGLPYPVFYFSALVPWTYFSTALQSCTSVVVDNQRVITKVYFPRLVLPLSAVVSGLVDFAIGFVVLIVVTAIYGIKPTLAALWLPLLLFLAVLTALAVGLWMSALNALYRDVRYVVPFLVQVWMFASPVAYPSSLVPRHWRFPLGPHWPRSGTRPAPSGILCHGTGRPPRRLLLFPTHGGRHCRPRLNRCAAPMARAIGRVPRPCLHQQKN